MQENHSAHRRIPPPWCERVRGILPQHRKSSNHKILSGIPSSNRPSVLRTVSQEEVAIVYVLACLSLCQVPPTLNKGELCHGQRLPARTSEPAHQFYYRC